MDMHMDGQAACTEHYSSSTLWARDIISDIINIKAADVWLYNFVHTINSHDWGHLSTPRLQYIGFKKSEKFNFIGKSSIQENWWQVTICCNNLLLCIYLHYNHLVYVYRSINPIYTSIRSSTNARYKIFPQSSILHTNS